MLFYYAARSAQGGRVVGSLEADGAEAALAHLRARSLLVTSIEAASSLRGAYASVSLAFAFRRGARAAFFRAFAAMASAGVPIRRALETLIPTCGDAGFAETLASIAADVDRGEPFSVAIARHPREFSRVARAMVRAGEEAGSLDRALCEVAELEERNRALRNRVLAAFAYPAVVAVASLGLVLFLLASTVPAFAQMFEEMHVPLPLATRALIAVGRWLDDPTGWGTTLAVACAAAAAARAVVRSEGAAARAAARVKLALPAFGAVERKSMMARFARTLGTLLRGGVEVLSAIETARDGVENLACRQELASVVDALRRGDTLPAALEASAAFDATFLQLVRAGEESGSLDAMLLRLAEYYELDVEAALAAINSAIEPLLICILGAAIGSIVASVIIPLYSMIGSIR